MELSHSGALAFLQPVIPETRFKIYDKRWDSTRFLISLCLLFVLSIKPRQQKFQKKDVLIMDWNPNRRIC